MPRPRRIPLTQERIVQAALVLLDREGLGALSMRRLAKELGVEAMSLYNHVASKDELLAAMVDEVLGAIEVPPQADDWRAWVRTVALRTWRALQAHPALLPVVVSGQGLGDRFFALVDRLFAELEGVGFALDDRVRLWELIRNQVFGSLVQQGGGQTRFDAAAYPSLARAVPAMACSPEESFVRSLDSILGAMSPPGRHGGRS